MIELYKPRTDELSFREVMLSDSETMSYNRAYGGTVPFPRERWAEWYGRWVEAEPWDRFYRYVKADGRLVGEVAYRFDEDLALYLSDVLIYAPYRGKGYGTAALTLLCQAARDNGIRELFDCIAADNPSVSIFLKLGFSEVKRDGECVWVKKALK